MSFVVVGVGAIGGIVGGHLARAGYEVLFVDTSAEHVDAINAHGLTIEGRAEFTVRGRAVTPDGLAGALDGRAPQTVILAVKAQHTAAALDTVAPLMGADSLILSLQNGLNERVIAERVGAARTMGAVINFGGDYLEPGRVQYSGGHEFYMGELDGRMTPRLERLGAVIREHFFPELHLTTNVWGYLWSKLGFAAILFATAVADDTMPETIGNHRYRPLLANLAGEVVRVADSEGVRCEPFPGYDPDAMRFATPRDWAGIHRCFDRRVAEQLRSLKQRSGMWRDLAVRHRRTEIDHQPGVVVRIASQRGVAVPLNSRLVEIVHQLEDGRRERSRSNLEELRTVNDSAYHEDAVR